MSYTLLFLTDVSNNLVMDCVCAGVLRMVVWFVRQSRWLDACREISLQFVSACVYESRRVRVCHVGACRTIVESGREHEFVPPQPLVVWG
jgi:hypothetical protein